MGGAASADFPCCPRASLRRGQDGGGEGMKAHCSQYGSCYTTGETRLPVLSRYGIPLVSQKTALWYNFSCPPTKQVWPCHKFCRWGPMAEPFNQPARPPFSPPHALPATPAGLRTRRWPK